MYIYIYIYLLAQIHTQAHIQGYKDGVNTAERHACNQSLPPLEQNEAQRSHKHAEPQSKCTISILCARVRVQKFC